MLRALLLKQLGYKKSIEAGVQTLLIDEDTSATNFMIRDERMQALVSR
ncbi:ABC-ATPase domain-containing protein [Vibrio chagasii]|nr:ABC-ATPase domain-containing protein [Vibrio chagasii]